MRTYYLIVSGFVAGSVLADFGVYHALQGHESQKAENLANLFGVEVKFEGRKIKAVRQREQEALPEPFSIPDEFRDAYREYGDSIQH